MRKPIRLQPNMLTGRPMRLLLVYEAFELLYQHWHLLSRMDAPFPGVRDRRREVIPTTTTDTLNIRLKEELDIVKLTYQD
jgi:hypothetical protein